MEAHIRKRAIASLYREQLALGRSKSNHPQDSKMSGLSTRSGAVSSLSSRLLGVMNTGIRLPPTEEPEG